MRIRRTTQLLCFLVVSLFGLQGTAYAQLEDTFADVFNAFLIDQIALSGEFHGSHYLPAANLAADELTPSLNSLIANNISSFPLSSTVAGITFDFSGGRPETIRESLGPIFAENAVTIGKGNINLGFSYSYLSLDQFRGLPVDQMRFTFIHEDITPNPPPLPEPEGSESLGDPGYESDTIDIFPNLDINSSIFVFFLTAGVTDNLDVGIALPIVNISLQGNAFASVNAFSFGRTIPARPEFEGAAHRFGGDLLTPILTAQQSFDESTNGLGDVALRLKYRVPQITSVNMAALLDVRLPTGDKRDFLGTGKVNARLSWLISRQGNFFNPHVNLGYEMRGGDLDSDEFDFILGFDQKITESFTVAFDLLGGVDLQSSETISLLPGSTTIREVFDGTEASGIAVRDIDLSNIPEQDFDHTFDVALGFRFAPSDQLSFLGSILVPLNNSGLRSSVAPTLGFTLSM